MVIIKDEVRNKGNDWAEKENDSSNTKQKHCAKKSIIICELSSKFIIFDVDRAARLVLINFQNALRSLIICLWQLLYQFLGANEYSEIFNNS